MRDHPAGGGKTDGLPSSPCKLSAFCSCREALIEGKCSD
jgi:hypothetical protein